VCNLPSCHRRSATGSSRWVFRSVSAGQLRLDCFCAVPGRDVSDVYQDLLQIDAPINKGNSGGPTFDISGDVVGINAIIFSPKGSSIGIAFAIPSDNPKPIAEQLLKSAAVTRSWLGIQFQSVLPEIADSLGLAEPAGILIAGGQPRRTGRKGGDSRGRPRGFR
jgi:serine protease Do